MFCPNCGKSVKEEDNFCRYCGKDLRESTIISEVVTDEEAVIEAKEEKIYDGEELMLYDIKKHWMSLFWSVFLIPLFLIYFWIYFLNTHSFFSWIIVFSMLALIVYPIARYKSDYMRVTTKSVHIKLGIIHPEEFEIPLENVGIIDVTQSSLGRSMDYGTATFCMNSQKYEYPYISYPEDLQFIVDNPKKFVQESLQDD